MAQVGAAALPVMVALILFFGAVKGVPVFDTFLSGAKEGIRTSLKLLPTLIGLIVAVTMVRASGLLELLCGLLEPLAQAAHIAPELLPLAFLRPISGSGASAYTPGPAPAVWPGQLHGEDGLGAVLLHRDHLLRCGGVLWGLWLQAPAVYHPRRPAGRRHGSAILHPDRPALWLRGFMVGNRSPSRMASHCPGFAL